MLQFEPDARATPSRLSLRLGYGAGAMANGVIVAGLSGAVLQIYLNQVLGLPALWVGTIIMVSLIADALIDPLIGYWSDRVRSRLGRRHPFMYAAAIPIPLFFVLLWNAPASLSTTALIVFTVMMMIAVRVASSLYVIPGDALMPDLTSDYDERTILTSYRWFFGIAGSAGVSYALNAVFLRTSAANPLGVLNRHGYAQFGLLSACIILVSIIVSSLATQRRARVVLPPVHPFHAASALRDIKLTLTNPSLLALLLAGVLGGIGGGVNIGLSVYLLVHFWGLDPGQYAALVPLGSLGSVLAVFAAPYFAQRYGKKAAAIGLLSATVITNTAPVLLRLLGIIGAGSSGWIPLVVVADGALTATVTVIGYILVGLMMADVVDDVAVRTGVRSEGLLYAVVGLLIKFTGGIGAFIAGVLLTVVAFPAHALRGTVPFAIVRHLVLLYLPVTVFFSIVSIAVLGLYRIDRQTQARNAAILHDT